MAPDTRHRRCAQRQGQEQGEGSRDELRRGGSQPPLPQEGCECSGGSVWLDSQRRWSILASTITCEHDREVVGSVERVMLGSGAAVSVCPLRCAAGIPMPNHSRRAMLRNASGAQTQREW